MSSGLAVRHGARYWLAALATAPVLLDAYQVQIEQTAMSDVWLEVLLVAVLWVAVARGAPRPWRAAVAGLLLAVAVTMRTIALPVVLPLVVYLVVVGGAWRSRAGRLLIAGRAGALVGCFAFASFCYVGDVVHLAPVLRQLCPPEPLGERRGVDWYSHVDGDPRWPGDVPPGSTVPGLRRQFALAVLRAQPFDRPRR